MTAAAAATTTATSTATGASALLYSCQVDVLYVLFYAHAQLYSARKRIYIFTHTLHVSKQQIVCSFISNYMRSMCIFHSAIVASARDTSRLFPYVNRRTAPPPICVYASQSLKFSKHVKCKFFRCCRCCCCSYIHRERHIVATMRLTVLRAHKMH